MSRLRLFTALLSSSFILATAAALAEETRPGPHMDVAAMHREFCTDHIAHKAGRLAYMAAKLNLTAAQKPLWDSYYRAVMASARSEEQLCLQSPAPSPDVHQTILDHQSRAVQMLQVRLQGMQSSKPALEALYQSLSTEQKTMLDEHSHRGFGHHGMMDGRGPHPSMDGHDFH